MDFKKLTRILFPFAVEEVLKVRRSSHGRLIEKIDELQFYTREVCRTEDDIKIELQILDDELFCQLLAGEANKFLLASRLSHDRSMQEQSNNASWQTIEHYYAAYYAAHYLIRITGVSLTNLGDKAVTAINRNLGALNQDRVSGGLYILRYDGASKTLILSKSLKGNSGGSHRDAWKLWLELVEKLRGRTDSDPLEYAGTSIELSEHRNFVSKGGRYNPPEIRGEINYQFKGGAWIFEPNSGGSIRQQQLAIKGSQLQSAVNAISPEGLISNNKIIIDLAKAIFVHSSEKYPNGICRSLANKYKSYVA